MERPSTHRNEKKYLSIREVQQEYGGSEGFWRKQVLLRSVPYVKFGRAVRIARSDIQNFITIRKIESHAG